MKNLLILHGALGAKSQFEELEKKLSPHHKVWSFNFDGHGTNSSEKDFSIDLFAKNTQDFLQQNHLRKCTVFGYSMGGYVALYLEQLHPGTFAQIITLGTKFDWTLEQAEKEASFLNSDQIEANMSSYTNYLKEIHGENNWKIVLSKTAQMMRNMGSNPPLRNSSFNQINAPVTLMRGAKDKMVSQEETHTVCGLLPHAKHLEIENWQHTIDRIDVDALLEQLIKLLSKENG